MDVRDLLVAIKDGEEYCEHCAGLGFRFGCRAPDDCEEFDCDECGNTGIKQITKAIK